jgi:hypothetical protein
VIDVWNQELFNKLTLWTEVRDEQNTMQQSSKCQGEGPPPARQITDAGQPYIFLLGIAVLYQYAVERC